eukprot:2205317-Lingulodinium_polyedra.AAC.1
MAPTSRANYRWLRSPSRSGHFPNTLRAGNFPKPNLRLCNKTGCRRNDAGHANLNMANGIQTP